MKIFETTSERETRELGKKLSLSAAPNSVYALDGDLGTGKTVFVKGFAEGLGITEPISSPTFTIMKPYAEGRLPLYHFDVYRISDPDELFEIGFSETLTSGGISLLEWGSLVLSELPPETVFIRIEKDLSKGTDYRRITVKGMNEE